MLLCSSFAVDASGDTSEWGPEFGLFVLVCSESKYVADSAADCLLASATVSRTITDRSVRISVKFART